MLACSKEGLDKTVVCEVNRRPTTPIDSEPSLEAGSQAVHKIAFSGEDFRRLVYPSDFYQSMLGDCARLSSFESIGKQHGARSSHVGAICLLDRRINFHLAIPASLAACANALTSLSAFLSTTKVATASLKACRNPAGAAAPWTQLGRSLSLAKEFIDQL